MMTTRKLLLRENKKAKEGKDKQHHCLHCKSLSSDRQRHMEPDIYYVQKKPKGGEEFSKIAYQLHRNFGQRGDSTEFS